MRGDRGGVCFVTQAGVFLFTAETGVLSVFVRFFFSISPGQQPTTVVSDRYCGGDEPRGGGGGQVGDLAKAKKNKEKFLFRCGGRVVSVCIIICGGGEREECFLSLIPFVS